MKRTFATNMPDRVGAFMAASEVMSSLGLNITRVSYNKAVDTHILFLEAEGDASTLEEATRRLLAMGYLRQTDAAASVLLMEFRLRDVPGSVLPVLKLIDRFRFNISYISSQADGSGYQAFRMGLLVEDSASVSRFIRQATALCDLRIIRYDETERVLDNTVFYVSFVNRIAEKARLNDAQKQSLMIHSNMVMELLDRASNPPYKTFEYIARFADRLCACRGDAYQPRVTRHELAGGFSATLIEPPCGSNTCVLEGPEGLLFVDTGFACYRAEALRVWSELFPAFRPGACDAVITHADVDHCGLLNEFSRVYLSAACLENFAREQRGEDNFREENPLHAPYVRISKILSGYAPPEGSRLRTIDARGARPEGLLFPIGRLETHALAFDVYEGAGGHVRGEIVLVERRLRILFTGDIYVNVHGFTPEQAQFNQLAPYLMTGVDSDAALAAQERQALFGLLEPGRWLLFGGHGEAKAVDVDG